MVSSSQLRVMLIGVTVPAVSVGAAVGLVQGGTERMDEKTLLQPIEFIDLS